MNRVWSLPDGLDTPCLVLDIGVLDTNVRRMAKAMATRGVALRPHFKTHKSIEIARRQLTAGAKGLTCATLGEAEVLADIGVEDVFIAFPISAKGLKGERLRALHERVHLQVGVDSEDGISVLAEALSKSTYSPLDVLVEIDPGYHRTGIAPSEADKLAVAAQLDGLNVRGVFTYGGHAYAGPDVVHAAANDEICTLAAAVQTLKSAGFTPTVVSAGSTPTALWSASGIVNEERPGTYVFNDWQQVCLGTCNQEDVALVVAATVVSTSVSGQIVLDAGSKILSSDRQPWLETYGVLANWPTAALTRLSEHHGIVEIPVGSPKPEVGDIVAVIPNHVCCAVNLCDEYIVCEDGHVIDHWRVAARGRNS